MLYNKYSDFLKKRYGEKVYKLPVKLAVSCPNRDGTIATGGCAYCGVNGAGHETLSEKLTVTEQLETNRDYIGRRYGTKKFLAYFQEFTSTHMPVGEFAAHLRQCHDVKDVIGVIISTRPDCLADDYLKLLQKYRLTTGMDIYVELGLQTANWHTLKAVNRGHGLAEFIDALRRCKLAGIEVCAHIIPNLPGDNIEDTTETARILSALQVEQVKLHALYIARGSTFEQPYLAGQLVVESKADYIERAIAFLRNLDEKIIVQRLIGRAPESDAVFANWNESWWVIHDEIEQMMRKRGVKQGDAFLEGDLSRSRIQ
ncbi:MAG: TIGR01212 family radical SAM protein [Negativicutes bacterium]|jgi:hypothetical protein